MRDPICIDYALIQTITRTFFFNFTNLSKCLYLHQYTFNLCDYLKNDIEHLWLKHIYLSDTCIKLYPMNGVITVGKLNAK